MDHIGCLFDTPNVVAFLTEKMQCCVVLMLLHQANLIHIDIKLEVIEAS